MVVKKCRTFEAERHRDENEVMILGACAVQVHCRVLRGWGWGRMCGVRGDVESLRVQILGSPWLGSKPRCRRRRQRRRWVCWKARIGQMRVRQRVGSETYNIESAHEPDEMLPPPLPRSRPMTVLLPPLVPQLPSPMSLFAPLALLALGRL
jgi:hypothetical protein